MIVWKRSERFKREEVYFTDAMTFPFEAEWRDPHESGHAESVSVLGVADVDDRRGVLRNVTRQRQTAPRRGRPDLGKRQKEERQRHRA